MNTFVRSLDITESQSPAASLFISGPTISLSVFQGDNNQECFFQLTNCFRAKKIRIKDTINHSTSMVNLASRQPILHKKNINDQKEVKCYNDISLRKHLSLYTFSNLRFKILL